MLEKFDPSEIESQEKAKENKNCAEVERRSVDGEKENDPIDYELLINKATEIGSMLKELYVLQQDEYKDKDKIENLNNKINENINEIYENILNLINSKYFDDAKTIELYQILCGSLRKKKNGYYQNRNHVALSSENYDQKIAAIEYYLEKAISMPEFNDNQKEAIIYKSSFIIEEINLGFKNFLTHTTETEMLPWLWDKRLRGTDDMAIENRSDNFGTDKAIIYGNFLMASKFFNTNRIKLQENINLRLAVSKLIKKMEPHLKNIYNHNWVHEVVINSNKEEVAEIINILKENITLFSEMWIDYREYIKLEDIGFFKREIQENFSNDELNIFANMLSRFRDQIKGGVFEHTNTDIALWFEGCYFNGKKNYLNSHTHTGKESIKAIQCATPYAFEKVMNFLKLQCYDKFNEYIPVFDKDGNMLWPRKMQIDELREYLKKE